MSRNDPFTKPTGIIKLDLIYITHARHNTGRGSILTTTTTHINWSSNKQSCRWKKHTKKAHQSAKSWWRSRRNSEKHPNWLLRVQLLLLQMPVLQVTMWMLRRRVKIQWRRVREKVSLNDSSSYHEKCISCYSCYGDVSILLTHIERLLCGNEIWFWISYHGIS